MPAVAAEPLRVFAGAIIEAVGTPAQVARIVGDSLVDANLAGHDSHGVLRLVGYIRSVRTGDIRPPVAPVLARRDRATACIDGGYGWGQPSMLLATETAIELAREFGVGVAVVQRCYHIGRVAPYVESIARAGMIGMAMSNAGPAVAPYGGRARVLGTNPFAWAMPRGEGRPPLSFDIATAGTAEGKLLVARSNGAQVAPGLIVDTEGEVSTDPEAFYAGGALLPFGGHKGYGFNVLAQMLGRGLAGMDTTGFDGPRGANGPVVIAIDVGPFAAPDHFAAEIEAQCELIAGSPPMSGFEKVQLPGDPELAIRAQRLAAGIPIPDRMWDDLRALAADLGVPPLDAREEARI